MLWLQWAIGLRYTLVGRGDRFVAFSSLVSAIGIALGVAAVIVVMAVMNGFHINLRDRILQSSSHVEVDAGGVADWEEVLGRIEADPLVAAAAPQIERQGLVAAGDRAYGVFLRGVDPARAAGAAPFLHQPDLDLLEAGSFKVLLGAKLAARLRAGPGDAVVLYAPAAAPTLGGALPRFRRLQVAALVSVGVHQLDNSSAFIHHEDAARLYRTGGGVDSLRLRLHDVYEAPALARRLQADEGLRAYDWTSSNQVLFSALAVERRVMFVILSLIIAVAAFQIVAALVAMVRTKRGAIAILRTIGMSRRGVVGIFVIQGMLVGVAGTVAGVLLGIAVAVNVDAIVSTVEGWLGFDFFPGEVYLLESIPSEIIAAEVAAVALLAFGLSLLAAFFPSLAAARVDPAEALRHE
ncbi:MAG: lipoprotein-releasing ABC transporter permease subunit [Betaproteobacteria bacterium AqS2]|uniref:Lipoprotein-releasing ABC transporter permease subunit n=1 Tax=Candidatus Amphirhobacter heronislandensis TaxID=1732024 RepID=A0A930XW72_9GAMM|nr:lipoprotein-releasing ABC transporter permease subunit [Betaproteobacteria bacterium AqS2]